MAKKEIKTNKIKPKQANQALQSSETSLVDAILKESWPLDRDVLFRPDRLKYVRKLLPDKGCVFCNAAKAKPRLETLCVYKTSSSMVIINKYPYNSGHVLVLPQRHSGDLLDLSDQEYLDLQMTVKKTIQAVQALYCPLGFNLGLNHGAVAGAGIPDHLHYHIVPRWAGDMNFFPLIAETKVLVEDVQTTFYRFKKYFQKDKK